MDLEDWSTVDNKGLIESAHQWANHLEQFHGGLYRKTLVPLLRELANALDDGNRKCEEAWAMLKEIRDSTYRHPFSTSSADEPLTTGELKDTIEYIKAGARAVLETANKE
jgi:hypothetical protein